MTPFHSLEDLDELTRGAVIELLYRLADDALILGHRDSEWTGLGPILEEDLAFSSMAQDEIGHARVYYAMLHELGELDPDALVFTRKARAWRCAGLVCLPNERDWAFCVMRKFLFDLADSVRLTAFTESSLVPLAQVAVKLRTEKKYHVMHGRAWVLRLGDATEESHQKMQAALDRAYPYALGLFEETEGDEILAQAGISPKESQLQREWESAVAPVLVEAGLNVKDNLQPVYGGRVGRHPPALTELLEGLQLVHSIDPTAKW